MQHDAEHEKRAVALSSIAAAVVLTSLKLGVGVATGSLGVLSEALHSGLDLLAAAVTYFAVRYSAVPPDPGHPYGHGKVENLSALAESLLLLVTCGWIIWEAVQRIFFRDVYVEPSIWAIGVMLVSIAVDFSRSRLLLRTAKKYNSQALEADALHFSTDILSSAVVIVGLGLVYLAGSASEGSSLRNVLEHGDALAALGVAAIVIKVSLDLSRRAIVVLLDAGDKDLAARLEKVIRVIPGVKAVANLAVRRGGSDVFVNVLLGVDKHLMLAESVEVCDAVRAAVEAEEQGARVVVEVEPVETESGSPSERVRGLAAVQGLSAHDLLWLDIAPASGCGVRTTVLELHVAMPGEITLEEAHAKVSAFEKALREVMPRLTIYTQIEPQEDETHKAAAAGRKGRIQEALQKIVEGEAGVEACHKISVYEHAGGQGLSFHCRMAPHTTVAEAHRAAARLQVAIHKAMPELKKIIVHTEPLESG